MILAGLQKLSLLDCPGQIACTVFTAGCNLRCPFCHNPTLVLPERIQSGGRLSKDELLSFLRKRRGLLDAVCITGGEPLMQPDLPDLMEEIRALGFQIKLDTNGFFPDRLRKVLERGLADRVAMDIKNGPSAYARTVGLPGLSSTAAAESRSLLLEGDWDYEFRTTVVRPLHSPESLMEAAEWIRGARSWALQQFRDSGDLLCGEGLSPFSDDEFRALHRELVKIVPTAIVRGIEQDTGD